MDYSRKVEILAPAGSKESLIAAINAGADAVYAGGRLFGARAYAKNLDDTEVLEAVDYVHLHGRKFYLTVNTLLKQNEIDGLLYHYLQPLYEEGLDAVIVQDAGVMEFISREFPGIPIHASTQMSLTMAEGAMALAGHGVTRLVNARELNLEEISRIRQTTNLEIESFVHGALCYCYSGQCLMSSLIGGRSGNRGRCAQPCRMEYSAFSTQAQMADVNCVHSAEPEMSIKNQRFFTQAQIDDANYVRNAETGINVKNAKNRQERFLLSPKDICTLDMVPQLIEAGIDSFKIEGRMKGPEYAAATVQAYRREVDRYFELGPERYAIFHKEHPEVLQKTVLELEDIYNRGGFSKGYYQFYNGREMMSMARPNHNGVLAAKITEIRQHRISLIALQKLYAQDVLEIRMQNGNYYEFTLKEGREKGEYLETGITPGLPVKKGDLAFRTKNQELLLRLSKEYCEKKSTIPVTGYFQAVPGQKAAFFIKAQGVCVKAEGEIVQCAKKQPLTKEKLEEQLKKTGDTPFFFTDLEIYCEDGIFLPVSKLNALRRDALTQLSKTIIEASKRKPLQLKGLDKVKELPQDGTEENQQNITCQLMVAEAALRTAENQQNIICQKQAADTQLAIEIQSAVHEKSPIDTQPAIHGKSTVEIQPAIREKSLTEMPDNVVDWKPEITASVMTLEQLEAVLQSHTATRIYYDLAALPIEGAADYAKKARQAGKKFLLRLPRICRAAVYDWLLKKKEKLLSEEIDGYLIQNYEELYLFAQFWEKETARKEKIADAMLYVMNHEAKKFFRCYGLTGFTAPYEENKKELEELGLSDMEMTVYGRLPLMTSAQCIKKNTAGCNKQSNNKQLNNRYPDDKQFDNKQFNNRYFNAKQSDNKPSNSRYFNNKLKENCLLPVLIDRKQKELPVKYFCSFCYNTIYNPECLSLLDSMEELRRLAPCALRFDFTFESAQETLDILDYAKLPAASYTRGHFRRGVI